MSIVLGIKKPSVRSKSSSPTARVFCHATGDFSSYLSSSTLLCSALCQQNGMRKYSEIGTVEGQKSVNRFTNRSGWQMRWHGGDVHIGYTTVRDMSTN